MHISSFLNRFKKLKDPKKDLEDVFIVINQEFGAVSQNDIKEIRNGVLFFHSSISYKTEIFLRKESLIKKLKEKLPHLNIKDIR